MQREWGRRAEGLSVADPSGLVCVCVCAYTRRRRKKPGGAGFSAIAQRSAPLVFVLVRYNGWSGDLRFERWRHSPISFWHRAACSTLRDRGSATLNRTDGCGRPGNTTAAEI